jgi:phospholipase/lecithinase/hemolysin
MSSRLDVVAALVRRAHQRFRSGTADPADVDIWHQADVFADAVLQAVQTGDSLTDTLRHAFLSGAYYERVRSVVTKDAGGSSEPGGDR